MCILYAYKLSLKVSSKCIHPNYYFYCFECVHRVCPNLSSAPCIPVWVSTRPDGRRVCPWVSPQGRPCWCTEEPTCITVGIPVWVSTRPDGRRACLWGSPQGRPCWCCPSCCGGWPAPRCGVSTAQPRIININYVSPAIVLKQTKIFSYSIYLIAGDFVSMFRSIFASVLCGSTLVLMWIRIRILVAKPMRIRILVTKSLLVNFGRFPCSWIRIRIRT